MLSFDASDALDAREEDLSILSGLSIGSGGGELKRLVFIATIVESDCADRLNGKVVTDALPDEVLLHTFYFYVNQDPDGDAWHTLVHVCQRWRCIVFASPKRLNLRLLCNENRLSKDMLDVWPSSLPIVISDSALRATRLGPEGAKIILAALKHHERISAINLKDVLGLPWNPFLEVTQPFPVLTSLTLHSYSWDEDIQVLPDSFLGGSCPRLQELRLNGIPFPRVWNLLLSNSHLIDLRLEEIPYSGYIAPEAMVNSLSALTKLESFKLGFRSLRPQAKREGRRLLTVTRVVLASLTGFQFRGDSMYLEEIVSLIDTPYSSPSPLHSSIA